jgi:probable HAF family extracellular repeat protein
VNDSGEATGWSRIIVSNVSCRHAYLYNGSLQDLYTLVGTKADSYGYGINNAGQIAGWSEGTNHWTRAFLWSDLNDNNEHDAGEMIDLGTLGGFSSAARAVNSDGDVAGTAQIAGLIKYDHAFIWIDSNDNNRSDPGEMVDLGTLTGQASSKSEGYGLNDNRVVVGHGQDGINYHAFLWSDRNGNGQSDTGEMISLGTLGGGASHAYDINNSNQVVGSASDTNGHTRAFIWFDSNDNYVSDPGEMQDLGTLGGDTSYAYGINNQGMIVGSAETTGGTFRAFLYYNDAMTNLNNFIDPASGWILEEAWAISDTGFIVGLGRYNGLPGQAFHLQIPEASGLMLSTAFILAGIGLYRKNRSV